MKKQIEKGFTLIELIIVVAIIGILAKVAIPAYQDYSILATSPDDAVRNKVIIGLMQAEAAKSVVEEAFRAGGVTGLKMAAIKFNNEFNASGGTQYVKSMFIYSSTGAIAVSYNTNPATGGITQLAGANYMILTPSTKIVGVNELLNTPGASGSIDWACTGAGMFTAATRQLLMNGGGTVASRYSPAECQ